MKPIADKATLIVAGAWNPAIVTPNWIARQILGYQADKQFQVGIQMPFNTFGLPPRMTFEGLSMVAAPEALTFYLNIADPEQVKRTFDVASKVLHTLSHTPVAALGINLGFSVEAVDGALAPTFDCTKDIAGFVGDDNAKLVDQSWHASIKISDHLVNVTCTKAGDGAIFGFNHHYELDGSASRAEEILAAAGLFEKLDGMSQSLINGIIKGGNA